MPTDKHFRTPEDLAKAFEDYKEWCEENPRMVYQNTKNGVAPIPKKRPVSLKGFATFCNLTSQTIYNYGDKNKTEYAQYFDTYARIKDEIDTDLWEGGMVEQYNPGLSAKTLGLADKQDHTSSDGSMSPKVEIKVQDTQTASDINKLK